jgi:hydroxypyruvate reductase
VTAITGDGSALLAAPIGGIDLVDLQRTTESLLASGADIGLVVSDVVWNRLDVIASGPLTPDGSTYAEALDILDRYDVDAPDATETWLREGVAAERPETPTARPESHWITTTPVGTSSATTASSSPDQRTRTSTTSAPSLSTRGDQPGPATEVISVLSRETSTEEDR